MAAWLASGLAVILVVPLAVGHAGLASATALAFVLTAVATLPRTWRAAVATIGARGVAVVVGASCAMLAVGHPLMLAAVTVIAAVCGALLGRVGPTAGLAVVLVAVDVRGAVPSAVVLVPYVVGALVVMVAWTAWFWCRRAASRRADQGVDGGTRRQSGAHAVRVGVAVAAAVAIAGLLPDGFVGGHWLVTGVLLTVQPTAADTGLRLAQRLAGNGVGAVIAAGLLGTHPSVPVVAAVTVGLFTVAMALRPVNYTWWAVTGPPVLLVISEYPLLFPWYEGGVRLAMNLVGAAIVVAVVFGTPLVLRLGAARRRGGYHPQASSDIVYRIQTRRL